MKHTLIFTLIFLSTVLAAWSQPFSTDEIKSKIEAYKNDARGPYQQIMWFCPDGSRVPPNLRCPEPGAQRATYKKWVEDLAKNNRIYLGQILAATDFNEFLDEANQYSRLKQYQIENYLENIDNGWILRKARFYRGAYQDEDENAWGQKFLKWMVENPGIVETNFFLVRQAFKEIPHQSDNANIKKVRALSLEIADEYPAFMNLRIKIHGQPVSSDIKAVADFKAANDARLTEAQKNKMDELLTEMEIMFKPVQWQSLEKFSTTIGINTSEAKIIQSALSEINAAGTTSKRIEVASRLMVNVRRATLSAAPRTKYILFDVSNKVEELIFKELTTWKPVDLGEMLKKNYYLSRVAAGAGYIELWEWEKIESDFSTDFVSSANLVQLNVYMTKARSVVEWSTGMIRATYGAELKLFESFEPLAYGFPDDVIRSSVLLHLGQSVGDLGSFISKRSGLSNQVLNVPNQSHFRGLNAGFAMGELVVADSPGEVEVSADKIYIFHHPPSDLKPVAGIATVSEGNLVSHVQLLARNLGIPNAVLSQQNLTALKKFNGKTVFYAVSNKGTVIMKLAEQMSASEKTLFETKKRAEQKIRVDVNNLDLNQKKILSLREVNAKSSGKICGPKAANLGQLKLMFPENVVEGLVVPFGIFRQHLDQQMPGQKQSYWQFLNDAFNRAREMEKAGTDKKQIDDFVLGKLAVLREAILQIPFLPDFEKDLTGQFQSVLGKQAGSIPVFLRSDTNMEDLKDFTGAGLNLTLFNVVEKAKILQGIKQVWASPYSERSFRWRQSYLLNPENVFPSILIIPTVNVDYSGVLITKGVNSGNAGDLTVAFSRGAGGAVDGQAAETYVLKQNGENELLAPAREPMFNQLPETGGTEKLFTTFNKPILNTGNLKQIREFSKNLKQRMRENSSMQGPFDVEFGFLNDKLWLFQVRPFVENKNAAGSAYLESISPGINEFKTFPFTEKI